METKQFIACLKDIRRKSSNVALRQALCYYLYNEGIPCTIMAEVMKKTKRYIYMSIYKTQDFLEVGDKTTQKCVDEVKSHVIQIRPITVDGVILSKHVGYKMIVDNVIL